MPKPMSYLSFKKHSCYGDYQDSNHDDSRETPCNYLINPPQPLTLPLSLILLITVKEQLNFCPLRAPISTLLIPIIALLVLRPVPVSVILRALCAWAAPAFLQLAVLRAAVVVLGVIIVAFFPDLSGAVPAVVLWETKSNEQESKQEFLHT